MVTSMIMTVIIIIIIISSPLHRQLPTFLHFARRYPGPFAPFYRQLEAKTRDGTMLLNHGVTYSLAMDTRNIHQITIYIFVFLCRYIHSLHLPCKFLTEGLPTHQTPYLRPHSFRIYILLGFCFVCACLSQFIS